MDGVRGVAGEGDTGGAVRRGPDAAKRKAGTRPGPFDPAEAPLGRRLQLGPELLVREIEQALRAADLGRPHDRAKTIRQRQQRERSGGVEHLSGDAAVAPLRAHRAHDAELAVAVGPRRDAGQLPDRGAAAVGPDEQARAEPRGRFPRIDDDFAPSERDAGNPCGPAPHHSERVAGLLQPCRDRSILHDAAEMGLADRLRLETNPGAARRLPDLDSPERGGGLRDPFPNAEPAENALRRDGERDHPAVVRSAPRPALHHRHLEPGAGEAHRGHQAGESPAGNDDVEPIPIQRIPPKGRSGIGARARQPPPR